MCSTVYHVLVCIDLCLVLSISCVRVCISVCVNTICVIYLFPQALLEAGASAVSRTPDGRTPLHMAAQYGRSDLVAPLVAAHR